MLATIKDMKARGIPLDAVGIQGHFFEPWASMVPPTKDGVIRTMQEYAALGVDVYITELDVNLSRMEGSHDEKWGYQAQIYKIMMDACLESGVCKGFGVFGIDDPHCWGICFPDFGCPPEVLPEALWFDAGFNPKPAFYTVMESLQEH
jgi:endo-1,4-beta-xylanase